MARFRAARANRRPRRAELAPPVLHGTTTRHLRSGRRNNSPRLVAHRFTVGDVPLCGRSTLSDPDTAHIDVDGRSTAAATTTTTTTTAAATTIDVATPTRERGQGALSLNAVSPLSARVRTLNARIVCVPDVRVVPYPPPEEARGAATRARKRPRILTRIHSSVYRLPRVQKKS